MQLCVVIVAGGSGKRMGAQIPKQFLELDGKPLLMHTIEKFRDFDESVEIITVLPENQLSQWDELQKKHSFSIPQIVVTGGKERFHSVKNGLEFVKDDSLVAIHDGVRPFVSTDTIRRCFKIAGELGNAVPAVSPNESLRFITGNSNAPLNRVSVKMIQTPQVFRAALIKKAYLQDYEPEFTDDATVLERTGEKINLVEGNPENIKITSPADLLISKAFLSANS